MNSIFFRLNSIANRLVMAAALEHQSGPRMLLRKLLFLQPMLKAVLLYQAGDIRAAKSLTDAKSYKNKTMQRIKARLDDIYLALNHWDDFSSKIAVSTKPRSVERFNDRVLMVVNSCAAYDGNGYAVRSTQLADALGRQEIETMYCSRLGYPWDISGREPWPRHPWVESAEGRVSLRYDPDWLVGGPDPMYWRAYAEYLKELVFNAKLPPGVIHAHSKYSNGIAAAIAGRELGIPVIYEMRGLWHLTRAQREPTFEGSDFYRYEERLEIWAAELADEVVVISEPLKRWLIENGVSERKISIIPNAIDPETNVESAEQGLQNESVVRLAFMGSITAYEGLDTVLEALALVIASGQKASLDIYGEGRYRSALEVLSKRLKLQSHVSFHGKVNKSAIREEIKRFDLFPVIRKDSELTRLIPPLKHLEPMLNARTVLISSLPALLSNVPECVADIAVPPADPAALALTIKRLASNPELARTIGEKSRKWVVSQRNWRDNAALYKNIYVKTSESTHL